MSFATNKFSKELGGPKPTAKDGLDLPAAPMAQWKNYKKDIKPGWYRDQFFYLFGSGVQRYERCLDAWKFLLPKKASFAMLGRNAYGSILVLQNGENEVGGQIGVLDTTVVQYTSNTDWMFPTLFSQLLPDRVLDVFSDDSAYQKWNAAAKTQKSKLEDDMILGIKKPLPVGGTMAASNFIVADLFEYYETTADVYRKAHGAATGAH